MSYIPKNSYQGAPDRVAAPRPVRPLKMAATALAAIADAAWSATRFPRYDDVPVSLATVPVDPIPTRRQHVPARLGPQYGLQAREAWPV